MAKKRTKKRTHNTDQTNENDGIPKTMVIQTSAATTGKALSQLTKDTRLMMAPHTAARLKERKNNRLRDYTAMAGPLGVTHLLLFNQSSSGPTLRIARTPRGPTLFFRITEYSLSKDINKILRNPKSPGVEFQYAPLLVLSNFSTTSSKEHPEEELLRTTFQNLFPALNTNTASLSTMKRVVLFHRTTNAPDSEIQVRHYAINTRPLNQHRKLRKVVAGEKRKKRDKVPDLSKFSDVSEFILGQAIDSASESEFEEDAKITVPSSASSTKRTTIKREDNAETSDSAVQQRGVKLVELGPRLTLQLYKLTSDISSGQVLYHRDIQLTPSQVQAQQAVHDTLAKEKAKRKAEQGENVKRKREGIESSGSRSKRGKLRAVERESGVKEDADGEVKEDGVGESRLDDESQREDDDEDDDENDHIDDHIDEDEDESGSDDDDGKEDDEQKNSDDE